MSHLKELLFAIPLLIAIVAIASPSFAQTTDPDPIMPPQIVPKKVDPGEKGKFKTPGLSRLYFSYDYTEEACYFTLPEGVESLDVELSNPGTYAVFTVTSDSPYYCVRLSRGDYSITCIADNGDIYQGYIYI